MIYLLHLNFTSQVEVWTQQFGGGFVSWPSNKQSKVALSTAENACKCRTINCMDESTNSRALWPSI